ncbi:MAG: YqgE/AlgH family protein [Planctomycetota bacterium]
MSENRLKSELTVNPANGTLLVATPVLDDSNFRQTVILLLQHNDQGSFGVVLNRPADANIRKAWENLAGNEAEDARSENIVHGGPVGGPVFAIHQHEVFGEMEMPCGIFVSARSENLKLLIQNEVERYKIVFGISSWDVGQLQSEIDAGCWFTVSADADHVFGEMEWMWEQQLRRYGREVTRLVFGLGELPEDPQLN